MFNLVCLIFAIPPPTTMSLCWHCCQGEHSNLLWLVFWSINSCQRI